MSTRSSSGRLGARVLIALAVLAVHTAVLGPSVLAGSGSEGSVHSAFSIPIVVILLPAAPRPPALAGPTLRRIMLRPPPPPEPSAGPQILPAPGESPSTPETREI